MAFTPAQRKAIDTHDRNVIVVAGAGSGKTSVLVNRYLALLDNHPEWPLNSLVAITFTQKAAQEMRDRVRQALEARLANAQTPQESTLWSQRLASMDSARIDTIHALCKSILSANAAEAGVDPGFDVLDEVDAHILLTNAIDDTLRQIVADNDPALRLFTEYGDSQQVRDILEQFISVDLPELPADLPAMWEARRREFAAASVARFMGTPFNCWQARGNDWLSQRWDACNEYAQQLFQAETLEARLAAIHGISTLKLQGGGANAAWGSDWNSAKADLKTIAEAAKSIAQFAAPFNHHDQRAAELLPLWHALIARVQDAYRRVKQANSLLDFDDLEARTRTLLNAYPHVRARYCNNEFKHVLVDEFQDTNAAQWDIVRALADPEYPGCLFVVGDARQSIYGFRGADVSVFLRVQNEFVNYGSEPVMLSQSFRTHSPLVNCFNALFSRVLTRDDASPARDYQITLGEPMAAFREQAPCDAPPLELWLVEKPPRGSGSEFDGRRVEAQHLAARIRQMVFDEKRPVYDKATGTICEVKFGHIAVLFQAMTNVTVYEEAFKSANIPYVTVAGRGYYDRQEVWDLNNLLQALYNPADNLALASVLRSPMFNLSDEALLGLRLMRDATGKRKPLWDALTDALKTQVMGVDDEEQPRLEFASLTLSELHARAGRVTIAELLRDALEKTGYLATLTGLPDGARRRGNVEKLIDKAHSSGKITLGAFRQYLYDLSNRETREGEAHLEVEGSVQLMSVHKSKGLEFPVVVLADASYTNNRANAGDLLAYDSDFGLVCKVFDRDENKLAAPYTYAHADKQRKARDDAERRRLFYVAATRAQDVLLVSGQVSRDDKNGLKASGWLDWMLDAFELSDSPQDPVTDFTHEWGQLRVCMPAAPVEDDQPVETQSAAWTAPLVRRGDPIPGVSPQAPALIARPPQPGDVVARSLTAVQIADLGSLYFARASERDGEAKYYYSRLRRRLLHDAPHHIQPVTSTAVASPRKLGEMVHRALRWWRFPTDGDGLTDLLRSYAWEQGIVRPQDVEKAVRQAREMLVNATRSDVYRWLEDAAHVYRELPFVYQAGERTIYGVIDVVFQRKDGTWGLIDYKTSVIPKQEREYGCESHARRFHLQVGVYAAAVREHLRQIAGETVVPDVFIHYIRYSETVSIPQSEWEDALVRIEEHVGLLGFGA